MQTIVDFLKQISTAVTRAPGDVYLKPIRDEATQLRDNTRVHHDTAAQNLMDAASALVLLQKAEEEIVKSLASNAPKTDDVSKEKIATSSVKEQFEAIIDCCIQLYAYEEMIFNQYSKANSQRAVLSGAPKDCAGDKDRIIAVGTKVRDELRIIEPKTQKLLGDAKTVFAKLNDEVSVIYAACIHQPKDTQIAVASTASTAAACASNMSTTDNTTGSHTIQKNEGAKNVSLDINQLRAALMQSIGTTPTAILADLGTGPIEFHRFKGDKQIKADGQQLREAAAKRLREATVKQLIEFSAKYSKQLDKAEIQKRIAERSANLAKVLASMVVTVESVRTTESSASTATTAVTTAATTAAAVPLPATTTASASPSVATGSGSPSTSAAVAKPAITFKANAGMSGQLAAGKPGTIAEDSSATAAKAQRK